MTKINGYRILQHANVMLYYFYLQNYLNKLV